MLSNNNTAEMEFRFASSSSYSLRALGKLLSRIGNVHKLTAPGFAIDLAVYGVILLLGVAYFNFYLKTPDLTLDATYPELARSLVENGSYKFDFRPETMFPPGFPLILAFVERLAGTGQSIPYHVEAVFAALGLLVTYELLRRVEGRAVAAAICILLATSESFFSFVTEMLFAEMPYFFFSLVALLLAWKMERSKWSLTQFGRILLLGVVLALSILIRSVGITLLMGLCIWMVVPIFKDRRLVRARVVTFIIPVILGLSAQVAWSAWAKPRQITEWTLPGWPQSYTSQLLIKNGNDPELGYAQLSDIPGRIATNITKRAAEVSQLLTRRETGTQFWSSPLIIGVIVLISVGLLSSLLKQGGEPYDWYFLCHESLFLTWPWDTETRFVLPVVPLAWLYLWRGGKLIWGFAKRRTHAAGLCFLLVGTLLAFQSAEVAIHASAKRYQPAMAALFWTFLALAGLVMFGRQSFERWERTRRWIDFLKSIQARHARRLQVVPIVLLAALVIYGCVLQIGTVRYNQNPNLTQGPWYQDIEAAKWIRSHEPADEVVMARKQDLVFHYTQHRVVWFPPISDPKRLMDGMRRHNVSLVLVVAPRKYTIWLPPEEVCFKNILQAYPSSFSLLYSNSAAQIYRVEPAGSTRAAQ